MVKKIISVILSVILLFAVYPNHVSADKGTSAKSYILMEATTCRVISAKNEHNILPIASTTKIMTALIALEQKNLQDYFTVDSNAIKVEGTSMGLREGDKVKLYDLAHGMLLSSGNDAANAAAVKIGGSIEKFAEMMNEKAKEIGMKNSNFITPSGLHNDKHYSTAYDMALLARYALLNKDFASICKKTKAQVEFGNPPFKRSLTNHNRLLNECDGCIGIKTGFTKKAGRCLVSAVTRNGVTLIAVTLNDPNDWKDHKNLFDYGFEQVQPVELKVNCDNLSINVVGGVLNKCSLAVLKKTYSCVNEEEQANLNHEIHLDKFYYAPIKKGDIMGEIRHIYNGYIVATTDLIANQDIAIDDIPRKKSMIEKIKDFLSGVLR